MKKNICILFVTIMLLLAGCGQQSEGTILTTTTKPITTTTNTTTTIPTTIPTTQPTTKPTIYYHNGPGKDESELTFTPSDVPEFYWDALNNRQPIYFLNGCYGEECHSGPCFAWLDDHRFPYLYNEIATSDYVGYAVVDMDGDGNQEVLIRDGDTLLLREKDGIVYAYSFVFRSMDYVYIDGTFTWGGSAGRNYGVRKLKFNDDNTYQWISLKEVNGADENGEDYDEPKYFVAGQEVTYDEFLEYGQTLCHTKVEFKKLTRYPVREKEELYPGG